MKTKNFPERKNDRRKLAYYNLKARINQLELEGKEVKTELRNELDSLEKKIVPNALYVKTKKNRTSQGKRRKEL